MQIKHTHGFTYLDFPNSSGAPAGLVVLLHGHGRSAYDLRHVAERIQARFPGVDVVSVQGPVILDIPGRENGDCRTWDDAPTLMRLVTRAAFNRAVTVPKLNAFFDAQLRERGLASANLGVFGFSLGGAFAAEAVLRRREACAALVCHSSSVSPLLRVKSRPDTLLVMGDRDFLYASDLSSARDYARDHATGHFLGKAFRAVTKPLHHARVAARLRRRRVPVTESVVPGLGHAINEETLEKSAVFIGARLLGAATGR